jgi:hypothetical protein
MRATAWLLAVAWMAGAPCAQAQQEQQPPTDVQRVAGDAIEYAAAMQTSVSDEVIEQTDRVFNAPPAEIAASIERARSTNTAERTRILALQRPNLRGEGIDLTFAADWLRDRTLARLEIGDHAITAAQAMLDAQASGDCTGLLARAADLDRLRVDRRMASSWADSHNLQQTLSRWAPPNRTTTPVAIDPPPANTPRGSQDDAVLRQVTQVVAKGLRCPLPASDARFEVIVRVRADAAMSATVSNATPAQRDALVRHVANARIPGAHLLRNSALVNQPIRLVYANHRLTLAP